MSLFRKIAGVATSGSGLAIADQGLVSATNFVVGVLLARMLGVEGFGWYAMAWLLVQMAGSLQQAFIVSPLLSLLPQLPTQEHGQYVRSLNLLQLGLILTVAAVLAGASLLPVVQSVCSGLTQSWDALLVWLCTFLLHDALRKNQYATGAVGRAARIDSLVMVLQLGGLALCYMLGAASVDVVLWLLAASYAPAAFLQLMSIRSVALRVLWKNTAATWQYARYLVGTAVLQWLSGNAFIVAAGALLGPMALGAVRMAQNLVGILNVLFLAIEHKAPAPMASHYARAGVPSLMAFTRNLTFKAGLLTVAALGVLALLRNVIIEQLYGALYLPYSGLVLAFLGMYALVFAGTVLRLLVRTVARNRAIFMAYVATAVSGLLLATPLVKHFGLSGVATGLLLTQAITLAILIHSLKKELPLLWKSSTSS